jgi:hypothetical protein
MYPLPPKEKHADFEEMSQGEYELLAVLVKATQALLGAVRRQAKRSFHDWLTATREAARGIGERAVRRAASERAHEELLSQERKMLQGAARPTCFACAWPQPCCRLGGIRITSAVTPCCRTQRNKARPRTSKLSFDLTNPKARLCFIMSTAGLLIKEKKDFRVAKALVLAFIAKEDPAHGRSSIKQRAGGASQSPAVPAATEGTSSLLRSAPPCARASSSYCTTHRLVRLVHGGCPSMAK